MTQHSEKDSKRQSFNEHMLKKPTRMGSRITNVVAVENAFEHAFDVFDFFRNLPAGANGLTTYVLHVCREQGLLDELDINEFVLAKWSDKLGKGYMIWNFSFSNLLWQNYYPRGTPVKHRHNRVDNKFVPPKKVKNFKNKRYRDLPYHNILHAVDVTATTTWLLTTCGMATRCK